MRIDELGEMEVADRPTNVNVLVRVLYDDHAPSLHRYLDRRVGRDIADDLLADTFRIAIEGWTTYDPESGSARNWLYGIATNLVRRHWRTEQRRRSALDRLDAQPQVVDDPLQRPAGTAAAHVDAAADVRELLVAIDSLDRDDYDLLVLTAWESMSSADVAEVLGIPRGTVRSRLHRIRRQLDAGRRGTSASRRDPAEQPASASAGRSITTSTRESKGDRT